MADLEALDRYCGTFHLTVLGALHPQNDHDCPKGTQTLVLLGPREPGFWSAFKDSAEASDSAPNPMDRWSKRIVGAIAQDKGAIPLFPFGGPPYRPFVRWATQSGQVFTSPVGLMVHAQQGLWVSFRGALAFSSRLDLPVPVASPCTDCATRPCLTACPVGAFAAGTYDVAGCHAYLDSAPGHACRSQGCHVRASCPVSQTYGRDPAQSAFHMEAFHP